MNIGSEKQRDRDEKVVEIEIERLHDLKKHPFKVQADSQMKELRDRYFPSYYTAEQMRREILTLLKINMESY